MVKLQAFGASSIYSGRKIFYPVLATGGRGRLSPFSPNQTEHDRVLKLQGSACGAL